MKMKIKTENIPMKPVKNNYLAQVTHFLSDISYIVKLRLQFTTRLFSPPIPIGKNLKAIFFNFTVLIFILHSNCRYTLFIFLVDFVNLGFNSHSNWPIYSHRSFFIYFLLWISLMSLELLRLG